jgi:predicted membrane channel-forming protein YqfA (hemolysin III family)
MHTEAKSQKPQSYPLGEEIANAITHGIGAMLAIAGLGSAHSIRCNQG